MPRSRAVAAARRTARSALNAGELLVARWRVRRLPPAAVVVCWDLDNTLVASGELIRAGRPLAEAIVRAEPVAGMLELARAVRAELPGALHVVLSVRTRAMRPDTLAWLGRHQLGVPDGAVCFVPTAASKPRVWRDLARGAQLLVVDDLSWKHELEAPLLYDDLVAEARRVADVYLGLDDIAAIAADPASAAAVARAAAGRLAMPPAAR